METEVHPTLARMINMFGEDNIADPEVFPLQFAYQQKLAEYSIMLEQPIPPVEIEGEPLDPVV
jgi:hypothetical protein